MLICSDWELCQWRYMPTKSNPRRSATGVAPWEISG